MGISVETLKQMLEQKSIEMNELKYKYRLLEEKYNTVTRYYYMLLEENEKLLSGQIKHNSRGAGRKAKFTEQDIESIKMYRLQGLSTRAIAELFNCSHTTINKLIKCKD